MIQSAMALAATINPVLVEREAQARQARGRRFRAALIDLILFAVLSVVINNVYGVTQVTSGTSIPNSRGVTFSTISTAVAWPRLVLVWMAYFIIAEALYGASLGKMLTGSCVVRIDGQPLGLGSIVTRNVLRLVDGLPAFYLIGGLSVLATTYSQRVGDRWAGTTVILRDQAVEPHATRRPAPGTSRALVVALLFALVFTVAFDYFGRPPIVLEGLFNEHRLMAQDLSSYRLGDPKWALGRVTYPLTAYQGGQTCMGSVTLNWNWFGWEMSAGTLLCPP